jgi:putative transcriptional regulator
MRTWLVQKRKMQDWTQLHVAIQVGISRAYYAQIELNRRNPSVRVARLIAALLGFDWILFFEDNEPEPGCSRHDTAVHDS